MRNLISGKILFALILIFALLTGSTAYSQKKSRETLPKGSIKLEYNYPSDKSVMYLHTSKIVQDMDINGQSMLVNVTSYLECNVKSAGKQDKNLKLEIKIDSMAQDMDTPQGASGGPVTEAKDKVFEIVITPSGKTTDLSEASKIVFSVPGSGQSDASQSFDGYFPELPSGPVKAGDKWITHDTVNSKTQIMTRWMPVESNCKFEGIEKINGIDCAKISAKLSGSMKMTNQTQGMNVNTSGTYTGTRVVFFAIKEGYFIKEADTTKMTGTLELPDQNMTFPVVMDVVSKNEMIKK